MPVLFVTFCKKYTEPEKSNDITYLITYSAMKEGKLICSIVI